MKHDTEDRSLFADMPGGMFPKFGPDWAEVTYADLVADRTAMVRRFDPEQRETAIAFLAVGSCNRKVHYTVEQRFGSGFALRMTSCGSTV
jgi:hypothetical protein